MKSGVGGTVPKLTPNVKMFSLFFSRPHFGYTGAVRTIVVGAGVAGLTCARILAAKGGSVMVVERAEGVGGRVASDYIDGFTFDRGFQVFFTAYPAAKRHLNYDNLDLRAFDPGAIIAQGDRRHVLSDPARDPEALLASALTGIVPLSDKLRTWRLSGELGSKPVSAILDGPDETTERFLRRKGFSDAYLENFARPFFGGIFLNRALQTSARCFQFDWKMLAEGDTVLPSGGMGTISQQLAEGLDVRFGAGVDSLIESGERITGVRLTAGGTLSADNVVIATPALEAARLTGIPTPSGFVGTTTVYLAGELPLWEGKKFVLNANQDPLVNHAAMLTNVVPDYAPSGQHLLSVSILGVPDLDDDALESGVRDDLARMFTGDRHTLNALSTYRVVRIYRIPYAQFAQPKEFYKHLPGNSTSRPGLYFAAEFTAASSLNAAMRSGEKAAEAILQSV